MKVYVASSFSLIPKVETIVKALEEAGHEITVKWWSREYEIPGEGKVPTSDLKGRFKDLDPDRFYSQPETMRSYNADLEGIEDAEALVIIAPDIASRDALVGANIELGFAIGIKRVVISIGALMNSTMYAGVARTSSIPDLLELLAFLGE